jgi:hypothetical protein
MPLSPEAIFKLKAVRLNLDGCVELLCNAINEASGKEALRIGCIAAIARELSSAVAAELPDENSSVVDDPSPSRSSVPADVAVAAQTPADEPAIVLPYEPEPSMAPHVPALAERGACLCAYCRIQREQAAVSR